VRRHVPHRCRARSGATPGDTSPAGDRHPRSPRHSWKVPHAHLAPAHGRQAEVEAGPGGNRSREWSGRDHDGPRLDRSRRRRYATDPIALSDEVGDADAGLKRGAARARQLERQPARLEPAITLPEPGGDDIAGQVGEATTRLGVIEQLDVGQPPLPLRVNQLTLRPGAGGRPRDKPVALMFQAEVDPRLLLVEERDALPDQLDLLRVVE